ncbi:DUF2630 family protein [Kribbella deserti]|uniref:DUF2630 family protein n=1 Tax=Kribbella deserti TaxID=1926257 RepID=A0ABV6QLH9_9ACTN
MTEDGSIFQRIDELVGEEHALRAKLAAREITAEEEHARLKTLAAELDRCWDLLRQRRAKREYGEDPTTAQPRPTEVVEKYLN